MFVRVIEEIYSTTVRDSMPADEPAAERQINMNTYELMHHSASICPAYMSTLLLDLMCVTFIASPRSIAQFGEQFPYDCCWYNLVLISIRKVVERKERLIT